MKNKFYFNFREKPETEDFSKTEIETSKPKPKNSI